MICNILSKYSLVMGVLNGIGDIMKGSYLTLSLFSSSGFDRGYRRHNNVYKSGKVSVGTVIKRIEEVQKVVRKACKKQLCSVY